MSLFVQHLVQFRGMAKHR